MLLNMRNKVHDLRIVVKQSHPDDGIVGVAEMSC